MEFEVHPGNRPGAYTAYLVHLKRQLVRVRDESLHALVVDSWKDREGVEDQSDDETS